MADELSELSDLLGGDPGLGEAPEAQQVDQVLCVSKVVFHPTVPPGVAERMSQVDPAAEVLQYVDGPVVSVGPGRSATFRLVRLPGPHSRTGRASSPASGSPRAMPLGYAASFSSIPAQGVAILVPR